MKRIYSIVAATAILASGVHAQEKKVAKDGLSYKIADNLRYEGVTQPTQDATAVTNRFVLGAGYKEGTSSAYVELTNVSALTDTYNDTNSANGTEAYSIVKDPAQTRLTQAKFMHKTKDLDMTVGRDMYTLDGHRFVGHVAWRQMPQTFDVAALEYRGIDKLKVKAAYVFGRHGIGYYDNILASDTAGSEKTNSVLLNANYKINKDFAVRVYDYMISSSHDTVGAAVIGSASDLGYKVEVAQQSTASMETDGTAITTIDSTLYTNLELSYKLSGMKFIAGYESLGGDATTQFETPWATGHKFNGWADKFLGTPANGLVDTSVGVVYNGKENGKVVATYHMFAAATGGADYGSEMDLLYKKKLASVKGMSYLVKYAQFTADTASSYTDATKVWASVAYKFASN